MARTIANPSPEAADQGDDAARLRSFAERYAQPVVVGVCIVAIAWSAWWIYRSSKTSREYRAWEQLTTARSAAQLRDLLDQYAGTSVEPSAQIQLAKEYYDAMEFARAGKTYQNLIVSHPDHFWAPTAKLGVLHCAEATGDLHAALAGLAEFMVEHPGHYLIAAAVLAQARCYERLGDLAQAKAACEDFLAQNEKSAWLPAIEQKLEHVTIKLRRSRGEL